MPPAKLKSLRHRVSRLALRLAITAIVLVLLLCCALRIYATHMAHRAFTLLDEASRITVGSTEDSVLPLVARYEGVKHIPEPPTRIDDCPDRVACAYQNAHIPDYTYQFRLSPFHIFEFKNQPKGLHRIAALLMVRTSSLWRGPLSLRAWLIYVSIPIRAGRVDSVNGGVYVEGRTRWLGDTWHLHSEMPPEWQPRTYAVDGFTLTMTYGGAGNAHHLTPAASADQFRAARSLNTHCVTDLVPCRCLADLKPYAFEYINQHPEVGSTIITEGCPSAPKALVSN